MPARADGDRAAQWRRADVRVIERDLRVRRGDDDPQRRDAAFQEVDVRVELRAPIGRDGVAALALVSLEGCERAGVIVELVPALADVEEDPKVRGDGVCALELDERRAPVAVFGQLHPVSEVLRRLERARVRARVGRGVASPRRSGRERPERERRGQDEAREALGAG